MRCCPVDGLPVAERATFCSGRCRAVAFRAARRLVASECVECGLPLEQKPVGRPRLRCGTPQCETARMHRKDSRQADKVWDDYLEAMAVLGGVEFLTPQWGGDYIEPAEYRTAWAPGCDLDPLAYAEGWDAAGFVAEFGRSGFPVGMTYVNVPATLGAGHGVS